MALTMTLPSRIGPAGGPNFDGVYRGQVGIENPTKVFYHSLSFTGAKYYTIDSNGGETEVDVTAVTTVQIFPTSGSGNLSVNDSFEFGLLKSDYDAGHRMVGVHINVTTISQNLTFNLIYFATDDTWKTAPSITGLSTFLTTLGDNHIHFGVPTDLASITHTSGTTVTRVYPFRLVITAVGATPVAPAATLRFTELQTGQIFDITTPVTDKNISLPNPHVIDGDFANIITPTRQSGAEVTLWTGQFGGQNLYKYWNGSAFVTLPILNDPTLANTKHNNQSVTPVSLTANGANAVGVTTKAVEDGGYIEAVLPSASNVAAIGLRTIDTVNHWMFGIVGGSYVVTENGVTKYTHATTPTTNAVLRVWLIKGDHVHYYIGDDHVYTSTVMPTQGLNGHITAAVSGTQIQTIKLIQFNTQDSYPLEGSMSTVTNFTFASETTATLELPATYKVTWVVPADWVANTVANSPNATAGYHFRIEKDGDVTEGDRLGNIRSMLMDSTNSSGLDIGSQHVFTTLALKFHDYVEFTQDVTFEVINLDTGATVSITLSPEDDELGEADSTLSSSITFNSGHRLMLRQLAGRNNQWISSGDCILS